MKSDKQLIIVNLLLALVLTGESLALMIGMNLNTGGLEWLSVKNYTLLAIDLVLGILLIAFSLKLKKKLFLAIVFFILAIAVGSHIFRNIDFVTDLDNRFILNIPLLIINNLKLLGALYAIALIIYRWMNWEHDIKSTIEELEE